MQDQHSSDSAVEAHEERVLVVERDRPQESGRAAKLIGLIVGVGTVLNLAITINRSLGAYVTHDGIAPTLQDVDRLDREREAHALMIQDLRKRLDEVERRCR